ncbi:MAG: alkaline shock response membrane anchor protein AmaP [Tissierellia bacterium]|nr:alkaline shock response membrane anchor protein AmaP [Tissierellia bacterium]
MRKGKKALDIIMAIVILFFSVIFYLAAYGYRYNWDKISQSLSSFLIMDSVYYIMTVLGGLLVIYAIFIFLRAIISKTVLPAVKMEMETGNVKITEESVESVVKTSLKRFPQISEVEKDVKLFGGDQPHINIQVSCATRSTQNVNTLGEEIQNSIKSDVENYSGLPVKDIEVNFHEPTDTSKVKV